MPSYEDFDFTDGQGPDTDPTPDDPLNIELPGEDDSTNYSEPGEGDSFSGQDPTVFAKEGDPDEPTAQTSDVPPLETEQQSAPSDNDPQDFGAKDDEDAKESLGDAQQGDVEDDTPDPAHIYFENLAGDIMSVNEGDNGTRTRPSEPQQDIDRTNVTIREPERVEPAVVATEPPDLLAEARNLAAQISQEIMTTQEIADTVWEGLNIQAWENTTEIADEGNILLENIQSWLDMSLSPEADIEDTIPDWDALDTLYDDMTTIPFTQEFGDMVDPMDGGSLLNDFIILESL